MAIPLIATITLLILPVVWLGPTRALELSFPVCGAWVVIVYSATRLGVLGLTADRALLSMTFWVFSYTFLGFVPLVQLTSPTNSLLSRYPEDLLIRSFAVVLVGMIAFDLGKGFLRLPPFAFIARRVFQERLVARQRTLILGGVALIGLPFLISAFGGWQQLFLARFDRLQTIWESTNNPDSQVVLQTVYALMTTPVFVAFLGSLALYRAKDSSTKKRAVSLWIVVLLGVATFVVNNPISTARFRVGTIVLGVTFYLIAWRKRLSLSLAAVAITILFLVVFPFADVFRYSLDVELGGFLSQTTLESQLVDKGDYDSFEQVVNSIAYVDRNGLSAGKQLMGTVLFWVPRSAWKGKPTPSGPLVAEFRGSGNLNLSLPLWGEFFLDGHFFLVLLGFLLYGSFVGSIEGRFATTSLGAPTFAGLFVPVYAAYQFFLLRGPLLSTTAYLTPVILCIWFCTRRSWSGMRVGQATAFTQNASSGSTRVAGVF